MRSPRNGHFSSSKHSPDGQDKVDFSAPLGALKSGRLVIASEVRWLHLRATPADEYFYQAHFWRFVPRIWMEENILTLEYGNFPLPEGLDDRSAPLAELGLNASIPWEIELHEQVSHLNADLHLLQLRSLDILSQASYVRLWLPMPAETVYLYISGGIHHSTIHLAAAAGARVQVRGGGANLAFDDQRIAALGEQLSLESANFNSTEGYYDICISGGIRDLTIDRQV